MHHLNYNFENKVAFVTGASSGIGRASAYAFSKCGANVVLVDTNMEKAQETYNHIKNQLGAKALLINCDVRDSSEVKLAIKKTIDKFGKLNFTFNNAGVEGEQNSTSDCTEENWNKVINTNLKGVWLCMKYQIMHMLKQGDGAIVNCSSIAGLVGFSGMPAYVASKHGIIGLTKTAALENAKHNIRVNAVCPGAIETPMLKRVTKNDQAKKKIVDSEPIGRIGDPAEIASAVIWLSSNQSSFVTGHSLAIDGGWLAQ